MSSPVKMQGYISFPRQKLPDSKKDDNWFKKNIDFAEHLLTSDVNLRSNFKNKKSNYNLRANIINVKDFEKYINPDNLDLESLPASFQHVGIENSKINLLLGEYSKRKKEFKAYISANDKDGISRKEEQLMEQITSELTSMIKSTSITEEEIKKRLEELNKYQTYDFQDIAEITANKILKKEQDKFVLKLEAKKDGEKLGRDSIKLSLEEMLQTESQWNLCIDGNWKLDVKSDGCLLEINKFDNEWRKKKSEGDKKNDDVVIVKKEVKKGKQCGACKEFGHIKSNKICPMFKK